MGENYRLGLLIHDYGSEFSQELEAGIMEFCKQVNCTLYCFPVGEPGITYAPYDYQKRAGISLVSPVNIDGLLVASGTQGNHISREELYSFIKSFKPLPVVSIGDVIPDVHSVVPDTTKGMYELVEHLIKAHKCRRLALMGVEGNATLAVDRENAYIQALKDNGIEYDPSIVMRGRFTYASGVEQLELYEQKYGLPDFDAIVALNDEMAFGCIDYCLQRGISVPDRMIITGYDDTERASHITPSLSTVSQSIFYQGYTACEELYSLLSGADHPPVQVISTHAVCRQSCGCVKMSETPLKTLDVQHNPIKRRTTRQLNTISEWAIKKKEILKIISYQNDTQVQMTLDTLRQRMNRDIAGFDISGAAVVLYKQAVETEAFDYFPLPSKAYVFTAYDNSTGMEMNVNNRYIEFNPQEKMLPPGILSDTTERKYVFPIYHCSVQYGYMIFRPGTFDNTLYTILCTAFSSVIAASYAYTQVQVERQKLTKNNTELLHISHTDELTGLLNRRGFMTHGQQSILLTLDMNQKGFVVFGDMDGLKKINDSFGHETGDRAIKAVAAILQKTFRTTDVIGRISGDEFGIVAVGMDRNAYTRIKARLRRNCKLYNETSEEPFTLSISLGAVEFSEENSHLKILLHQADELLYVEKRRKKAKAAAR